MNYQTKECCFLTNPSPWSTRLTQIKCNSAMIEPTQIGNWRGHRSRSFPMRPVRLIRDTSSQPNGSKHTRRFTRGSSVDLIWFQAGCPQSDFILRFNIKKNWVEKGLWNCLWFWSLGCCAILAGKLQLKSIIPLLVEGHSKALPKKLKWIQPRAEQRNRKETR